MKEKEILNIATNMSGELRAVRVIGKPDEGVYYRLETEEYGNFFLTLNELNSICTVLTMEEEYEYKNL